MTLWVRGAAVVAIVASTVVCAGLAGNSVWWVSPAVVTAMVAVMAMRVGGRSALERAAEQASYRVGYAGRARSRTRVPAARDVLIAGAVCGVRDAGEVLVAMIQLAPNLDLPTVVGQASAYTEDIVSVDAVLDMLDQFGVMVDIDIVTTGQRMRTEGGYTMLYHQLVGSNPAVGSRLTWLVLRLDQQRNLKLLSRRGPYRVTAPKALAAAAHRIASRLRERGVAAHPLPAAHLGEATRLLHAGTELAELRETRRDLVSARGGRAVTSYCVGPDALDSAILDECWACAADHTTIALSLSRGEDAAVQARALVRYVGARFDSPPVDGLRLLRGSQSDAFMASLPVGAANLRSDLPVIDPAAITGLQLPIGPSGQILGALSGRPGHALALPLFDQARFNPRRRFIDVRAQLPIVQQLVLRAAAVGAEVEIHSARPHRWLQLVTAFGDTRALRLAGDREAGAITIAVFDQIPPTATTASTVITVAEPGAAAQPKADLAIDQVSPSAVDVSIPMHTVRVDLIGVVGETRYLDDPDTRTQVPATGR
jgi:type VII secretion protein EccE